jgi:hypothetical protein
MGRKGDLFAMLLKPTISDDPFSQPMLSRSQAKEKLIGRKQRVA